MGTDISFALTVFSVFAPAGAIAILLLGVLVLLSGKDRAEVSRLEHWLILPLAICMTGLVASATHLGSPSNALYVFVGWGRSPLSNEVTAAVSFMFAAGLFWLSTFSDKIPPRLSKVFLLLICAMSLWLVGMISVVYSIPTIQTWNSPLVPFILWAMACVTGPMLAVATVVFAKRTATYATRAAEAARNCQAQKSAGDGDAAEASPETQAAALGGIDERKLVFLRAMPIVSLAGLACGVGLMMAQNAELASIENSFGVAADLVPWYGAAVGVYAVLCAIGIVMQAVPLFRKRLPRRRTAICSMTLIFIGSFAIRVAFYSLRMTTGF